jgi:hypothetical protein
MEARNIIQTVGNIYKNEIKPIIEEGHTQYAGMQFFNLDFMLRDETNNIRRYHSGLNLLASSEILLNSLTNGENSLSKIRQFEAYLTQTEMSIDSGNMF